MFNYMQLGNGIYDKVYEKYYFYGLVGNAFWKRDINQYLGFLQENMKTTVNNFHI
jgi:hypothetical protein